MTHTGLHEIFGASGSLSVNQFGLSATPHLGAPLVTRPIAI